ncbi:aminotransferase, classes I and II [Marinomonas sp. MED121]|uniref:aminotransferase class I/II-fold pyridoxal phosphate-dependent enzyme n=1 Tax=Marinomonas sp. MED121 TaxID=314277 RepID=UPI0000690F21|nr:aminotransferase class I/II-fold pyridoxal phosphate-dependent enzyme [Marinomonas sp. MED121]EAQ64222.1 aminotransferase, classes I and II [Marinomonas sp. MED121]
MSQLANRVEQISPFQVMAILGRAKEIQAQGVDVIHLEVGEPDFVASEAVKNAGVDAIEQGLTGYTSATGLPQLKQKIAAHYQDKYQVEVDPNRIIVTPGASGALQLLASLMVDAGKNVLMPDPCYPCNRHFLIQVGANANLVATSAADNFEIPIEKIDTLWNESTTGMWLASPANPTGAVLSKAYIQSALDKVTHLGGHLMIDEIYQGLVYEGEDFTALSLSDDIFVINSFSKYFAMTGWRLGWIVVPEWAIEAATKLAQNFFISAPTISQYAALEAFSESSMGEFEQRRLVLDERRKLLVSGLEGMGLKPVVPAQGAFYIYVDVSSITDDAMSWCLDLLEAEAVALTPGADFGKEQAHKYVRFAYTCDTSRLQQALARIKTFIEARS